MARATETDASSHHGREFEPTGRPAELTTDLYADVWQSPPGHLRRTCLVAPESEWPFIDVRAFLRTCVQFRSQICRHCHASDSYATFVVHSCRHSLFWLRCFMSYLLMTLSLFLSPSEEVPCLSFGSIVTPWLDRSIESPRWYVLFGLSYLYSVLI